jgi:hypothetical protein
MNDHSHPVKERGLHETGKDRMLGAKGLRVAGAAR